MFSSASFISKEKKKADYIYNTSVVLNFAPLHAHLSTSRKTLRSEKTNHATRVQDYRLNREVCLV